jgi:hypothetical protein
MASKKLKRALMAGLAGAALVGSAKMKGEALKKGSVGIGSDTVASGIKEKTGIISRIDDFFKKKGMETDQPMFGLGPMDGAKAGKMIKATHGTMVMAKGNKLARSKPTKLS